MRCTTPVVAVAGELGEPATKGILATGICPSVMRNCAAASVTSTPLSQDQHSFGCGSQLGLRYGRCRCAAIELPVQREGSVDQSEVCEGLREVADLFPGERDFF